MKIAYHGTSADNFKKMLDCGYIGGYIEDENWTVSEPNTVYMWDAEDDPDEARMSAQSSAEVPLVVAKDCRRVVLELDITDIECYDDVSCENMEGAICTYGKIPTCRIVNVWMDTEDLSLFKIQILQGLLSRDLYNYCNLPYNARMLEAIKHMEPIELYWQDEFYLEQVEVKIGELVL